MGGHSDKQVSLKVKSQEITHILIIILISRIHELNPDGYPQLILLMQITQHVFMAV